ncbi:MAG: hypothetical protein CMO74_13965 [Verrucomicrobiales bacterium]|nr:hypothetical protein [Verrucomicrobiales bacterium]|tara:strand:+ start:55989 stop:56309 length:321 start_codon:yes stop_codon:yes gene_type:complete
MKIKLGIRGNSDQVSAIIIKLDDLMLVTADNLFLSGTESRANIGKSIVSLLESLSCVDNQIEIGETIIPMIESELYIEEGILNKFITEKEPSEEEKSINQMKRSRE